MKKNKITLFSVAIISLLSLVIGISFAWLSVSLESRGNKIQTGKFNYEVIGYNVVSNGSSVDDVSTLINSIDANNKGLTETDLTNMKANNPIIDTVLNPGDIYSAYVSIEFKEGSIDFDYSLSFSIDTNENRGNDYLGAFTFLVSDITTEVNAKSGSTIKEKISAYQGALSNLSAPTQSMNDIENFRAVGRLTSSSSPSYAVYRIDVALSSSFTSQTYAGLEFVSNVNVMVAQKGSLDNSVVGTTLW